jgi:hypothetical protein
MSGELTSSLCRLQVGVALEHIAIFGRDLIGLEIGQAGHRSFSLDAINEPVNRRVGLAARL